MLAFSEFASALLAELVKDFLVVPVENPMGTFVRAVIITYSFVMKLMASWPSMR